MSTSLSFDVLTSQVLALPPEQRAMLAERLWRSVEGHVSEDEELFAEFDRRCAEIDSGEAESIPFDQAMREIRARLNES
jgi:putative addiction module component (TIGR02574 family)